MTGKGMVADTKKDASFWVRNFDTPPEEAPPIKMEVRASTITQFCCAMALLDRLERVAFLCHLFPLEEALCSSLCVLCLAGFFQGASGGGGEAGAQWGGMEGGPLQVGKLNAG
jgi:hypothetical protein